MEAEDVARGAVSGESGESRGVRVLGGCAVGSTVG